MPFDLDKVGWISQKGSTLWNVTLDFYFGRRRNIYVQAELVLVPIFKYKFYYTKSEAAYGTKEWTQFSSAINGIYYSFRIYTTVSKPVDDVLCWLYDVLIGVRDKNPAPLTEKWWQTMSHHSWKLSET